MHFTAVEFEFFLRAIVKAALLSESEFKKYEEILFKSSQWPEGDAQTIALDFMATKEVASFTAASRALYPRACLLSTNIELDDDAISIFQSNLQRYIFQQLGYQLMQSPENGHKILAQFQSFPMSDLEWSNMQESIESTTIEHLEKAKLGDTRLILSDFPKLSTAINGFNPGRITLITAASGFGKTKLAINLAHAFCKDQKSCRYFNMEMIKADFVAMLIQKEARIRSQDWSDSSFVTNDNLSLLSKLIQSYPKDFWFTNGSNLTATNIIGSIYKHRPEVSIIDYDQKMILDGKDEWFAMLKTIEKLEDCAKLTNSHIIILAQANDDGDLKSSKRSKQPASAVLNFYSDEHGNSFIKSIKNRFEKPFTLEVDYRPEISLIRELDFKIEKPKIPNEDALKINKAKFNKQPFSKEPRKYEQD